jgi:hypothetical protein
MKRSGQHALLMSKVLSKQSHGMLQARLRDRQARSSGREAVVYLIICRILITLFGAILLAPQGIGVQVPSSAPIQRINHLREGQA